jgi:Flp pilus assembly protein TadB
MAGSEQGWVRRFDDDLIGLDPDDPEARAFAQHLERMQRDRPAYTVEGYIDGVRDFADSANRAQGARYWAAVAVVALLLVGVVWVVGRALLIVLGAW